MENEFMENVSTKRSSRLIANFIDGFADGWHMAVKDCLRPQLDIKLTERKRNKLSYEEWTQGPYFCFSEGHMIFDSREGYGRWEDGLKYVSVACQVIEAKPNTPIKSVNLLTEKPEFTVLDGFVKFVLYKPNEERTQMVQFIGYELTQNQFVEFLRTGKI
jgi:hypothetical protein